MIRLGPLRTIIPNNGRLRVLAEPRDYEYSWSLLFEHGDNRMAYRIHGEMRGREFRLAKFAAFVDLHDRADDLGDYGLTL